MGVDHRREGDAQPRHARGEAGGDAAEGLRRLRVRPPSRDLPVAPRPGEGEPAGARHLEGDAGSPAATRWRFGTPSAPGATKRSSSRWAGRSSECTSTTGRSAEVTTSPSGSSSTTSSATSPCRGSSARRSWSVRSRRASVSCPGGPTPSPSRYSSTKPPRAIAASDAASRSASRSRARVTSPSPTSRQGSWTRKRKRRRRPKPPPPRDQGSGVPKGSLARRPQRPQATPRGPRPSRRPAPGSGAFTAPSPSTPPRVGRDAAQIAAEVIAHLQGAGDDDVTVTLEIEATIPGGASGQLVRPVTENSRRLRFGRFGFEEE